MRSARQLMVLVLRAFFAVLFAVVDFEAKGKVNETIELYSGSGFVKLFNKIRFWDAPMVEIEKMVPRKGLIIDLGSGDGLLGNFLALSEPERNVVGVELNEMRAKEADRGLKNVKFEKGDILKTNLTGADVILLVDVLHHLPSKEKQRVMIRKCRESLQSGDVLIVAEIIEKPFLKYCFTWFTDAVILPILFEGKFFSRDFYYRKDREWLTLLRAEGFRIKKINFKWGMPFSHVIYKCTPE